MWVCERCHISCVQAIINNKKQIKTEQRKNNRTFLFTACSHTVMGTMTTMRHKRFTVSCEVQYLLFSDRSFIERKNEQFVHGCTLFWETSD